MSASQPQVEHRVNRSLLARVNPGFHAGDMSPLGKTISARLKQMEQTQAWLAEQVGVSENAVSKWILTGKISRANAIKAATALQMSVSRLLSIDPTPELDDRWHALPLSTKQRLLALVDDLLQPAEQKPQQRHKNRAHG